MKAMMRPLSILLSPASIVMAVSTAGLRQWIWMVHCCHRSVNIVIHHLFVFTKILRYGRLVGRFVGYTKLQIIWFLNWMMAHDSIPPPSTCQPPLHHQIARPVRTATNPNPAPEPSCMQQSTSGTPTWQSTAPAVPCFQSTSVAAGSSSAEALVRNSDSEEE